MQNGHLEANEVSRPSHHLTEVWNSREYRCQCRPTEGATESHALAWGAEADNSRALFTGEEDIKSVSKRCLSNFWDRDRWPGGSARTDSIVTDTWLLNVIKDC